MTQCPDTSVAATADQTMRRLVNALARLTQTCRDNDAELRQMDVERQQRLVKVERTSREAVRTTTAAANGLDDTKPLGSLLRTTVCDRLGVVARHADAGPAPKSFDDAVEEWSRLAPGVRGNVDALIGEIAAWDGKLIKRAKRRPQVPDGMWRQLDRLDLIRRAITPLSARWVAEAVRQAADDIDVVIAAETERRRADERAMADEVKDAAAAIESSARTAGASWSSPMWTTPKPATELQPVVRLGELITDLTNRFGLPPLPAVIDFPFTKGLAIGAAVPERENAASLARALMLRLFAATPPGHLHVKAVDPVAIGRSVAEFRHLSDYDAQLMDDKTWTSERDIERLMDDLSDHLQVVISKYLRGQFQSIDDYNAHAGELAQPYRLLTIFDYPAGFSDRASKQLLSLIENGPRCGVYTIMHYDPAASRSPDRHASVPLDRLLHDMQSIVFADQGPTSSVTTANAAATANLADPVGCVPFELTPEVAPPILFDRDGQPETAFASLLPKLGTVARAALTAPPLITFDALFQAMSRSRTGAQPEMASGHGMTLDTDTWWRASTVRTAVAPIGRSGVQDVVSMHFSSTEVAGGAIMVGLPRSGKTTALHAMILGMSLLYSPDELELYLIDAKHGVEFKIYERLPHARMVSVRSEREFSLAVLQSIQKEIQRRADLMKSHGAGLANITEYRTASGDVLPRIVLVIDEFHELFEEPDAIGMAAFASFSDIVRMGPFSGVHIVVASQTLSSMPAMDRPTLTLLPQRVAFMCNDYDADIVLGDTNRASRTLSKTGEGVFNPSRGDESRNQLFQGVYTPPDERKRLLDDLNRLAARHGWTRTPRVFDGDSVASRPARDASTIGPGRLRIPVGEPFTLDPTEDVVLPRSRGANIAVLGPLAGDGAADRAVRGAVHSVLLAASAQGVHTTVVDFIGDDVPDEEASMLDVADAVGATYARSPSLGTVLEELTGIASARSSTSRFREEGTLLILYGIQRALAFTPRSPYEYADDAAPSLASVLETILAIGPEVGVHAVLCADRADSLEARLGTDMLAEVTVRIAGSSGSEKDLSFATGTYGQVSPLRAGQLLVGDVLTGRAVRVRGYDVTRPTVR